MTRGRLAVACAVLTSLAGPAEADRIALESYVGSRPADAERVMSTLRHVLARHDFVSDPAALAKTFAAHAWRSGGSRAAGAQMSKDIDDGTNAFFNDDIVQAIAKLRHGLDAARANPIAWANEPKYHDQVMRGLLYYALALGRKSQDDRKAHGERSLKQADSEDQERDATMAELIRSFPTIVISAKKYGQEAEDLFQRVRKDADKAGRGSLEISVSDPDVAVYIDERIHEHKSTIGDLVPGVYRVLVVSRDDSREYDIEVLANHQVSRLHIDWDLDSALTLNGWAGFKYPSEQEHAHEGDLVAQLVGKETNATLAAVFTVGRANGHPSISAIAYGARSGKKARECNAELKSYDDETALEGLATCLLGSDAVASRETVAPQKVAEVRATKPVPPIEVAPPPSPLKREPPQAAHPAPVEETVDRETAPQRGYLVPATVVGAGLLLAGVGAYLDFTVSPPPLGQPQPEYLYSKPGIGLMIGGGVAAAVGGYLWYRTWSGRRGAHGHPTAEAAARGVTLGWTGAF